MLCVCCLIPLLRVFCIDSLFVCVVLFDSCSCLFRLIQCCVCSVAFESFFVCVCVCVFCLIDVVCVCCV